MSSRILASIAGLLVVGIVLVLLFTGGSDQEQAEVPDFEGRADSGREAAPAPALSRPSQASAEAKPRQKAEGIVVLQASGGEIVVGKDPVPVYDLVTGEKRTQVRWMAEPLRAAKGEKYVPDFEKRVKRKTVKGDKGLKMPTASGKDGRRAKRDWYKGDGEGG